MTSSPLSRRLDQPTQLLSLEALCSVWFVQVIEARVPMMGVLAGRTDVLPKIRGAWGRSLMTGASQEAIAGRPCPFDPPCGLDVFFREQGRSGRHAIPKPYVLEADRSGVDLIVRLKIFGFATEWTPVASERLVEALNVNVDWRWLSEMPHLKAPRVEELKVLTVEGLSLPDSPPATTLRLLSPLENEARAMRDQPWGVVARIARRVSGLARWHDAEIDASWEDLSETWKRLDYDLSATHDDVVDRRSRGRGFSEPTLVGDIRISGDLGSIWPLLRMGETAGAGRGAVHGLGRFEVLPGNAG